jgi:hypothetical protein
VKSRQLPTRRNPASTQGENVVISPRESQFRQFGRHAKANSIWSIGHWHAQACIPQKCPVSCSRGTGAFCMSLLRKDSSSGSPRCSPRVWLSVCARAYVCVCDVCVRVSCVCGCVSVCTCLCLYNVKGTRWLLGSARLILRTGSVLPADSDVLYGHACCSIGFHTEICFHATHHDSSFDVVLGLNLNNWPKHWTD